MHDVRIVQLQSQSNLSYLNVDDEEGHIAVWSDFYRSPTYICKRGISFMIIQFDDSQWAKEWIENNKQNWESIRELESVLENE